MSKYNSFQEYDDLKKLEPKLKKARIDQARREKGKIWAICNDSVKEKRILTIPCPNCGSVKITVSNRIFTCTACKISYKIETGIIKILKNE